MADIFDLFKKIGTAAPTPTGAVTYLVACLGNPGKQYENTRHNVGFQTADLLSEKLSCKIERAKFQGITGETTVAGQHIMLLKPSTFMNLSGQAVREAMQFYQLSPAQVLLIFDDISLEPGKLRVRPKGSAGGHNGLKSIFTLCGSEDFPRIKIGVGAKPHPDYDLADWVLGTPDPEARKAIDDAISRIPALLPLMVEGKLRDAANRCNL